jgi:membrane-bound lytic murein transglycosylase A
LKFIYLFIFFLLAGCEYFNTPTPCNCDDQAAESNKSEKHKEAIQKKSEFKPYSFLTKVNWAEIKTDLEKDYLILAWPAWKQGCSALAEKKEWQLVCDTALKIKSPSNEELLNYFYDYFDLYQARNLDGTNKGLVTGYYQPILKGSWEKTKKYTIPLYGRPNDLITVDLSEVYPDLKYKRLRGRVEGNKLIPYLTREEISTKKFPLQGNELLFLEDPVEAFFLEIQGSGLIIFDNGTKTQIGYADQNGHPYRSMGRALIQEGELKRHKVSMQSIKAWAKRNKKKLQRFLNVNPSFVFFRELPKGLPGPIGAMGVPVTAERSIAVDRKYIPLGAPVFLSTTQPNSKILLSQLMFAQDTGGAISGGVRADFYWGNGRKAAKKAGMMKQSGKMWVILPKGFSF